MPQTHEDDPGPESATPPNEEPVEVRTRAGRTVRPPELYVAHEALAYNTTIEPECDYVSPTQYHEDILYAARSDPDVMYMHQALQQPDKKQFLEAMQKEVAAHTDNGNWVIMSRAKVPKGEKILPLIWAMLRKRHIDTQEVYKWKARLNIHGGKQFYGVH
jgi:hypothetical protein